MNPKLEPKHLSPVVDLDADFEKFWNAYPRHRENNKPGGGAAKHPSRQKWHKLKSAERAACLEAVDNYRADCERENGSFPAHVTTWLNQRRWEDWQSGAESAAPDDGFMNAQDYVAQLEREREG